MTNNSPEINKILVPISIGNEDIAALKQALVFQKIYNCEIIILNVLTKVSILNKLARTKYLKKQLKKSKKHLKKFTTSFFGGELPDYVTLRVTSGSLVQKILITAERIKCDLIILKKRNRKVTKFSLFRRENADKIISGAFCPVLTIPGKHAIESIKNILIPVDITKKTTIKISWAKYLAKKFNAKVHIVYALSHNISPLKSLAYKKASSIEKTMKEAGLDSDIELLKTTNQSIHDVILSHIADLKPDLVLMMTHQESILFDDYIGKFATEIIHRSISPIFSLVPRKEMLMTNFMEALNSQKKLLKGIKSQEKAWVEK